MVNISRAYSVFDTPFVLLAFAITLRGINTLREQSKDKRKSRYNLTSVEGKVFVTSGYFISCQLIANDNDPFILLTLISIERRYFIFGNIPRGLTEACDEITLISDAH